MYETPWETAATVPVEKFDAPERRSATRLPPDEDV